MKKITFTFILLQFMIFSSFAQGEEQAFEELKNAFIEAIKTGNDESLLQYRVTSKDIEEIVESIIEDNKEEARTSLAEAGGSAAVAKKYNDYFDESFNKFQGDDVKALDLNKVKLDYDIEIQEEEVPIKLAQVKIYQPDKEPMIDVNLLKLKRGWIIMKLDVYYKEFSEASSEEEIIKE